MEDEDVIDTHQLYPWRRTLDNSVYKDLLKVLGPARPGCFRRSALTVVPSVYCPLYAYMNPVPGHGVWINKSTMILYRLWGPTWPYNTWFTTPQVPMVAAGMIPTANFSCSDSDILEG